MKANEILKASILDLLFENRNKLYGAYELRKNYPQRLKKSIILATLLVSTLFIFISSFNTQKRDTKIGPMDVKINTINKPKEEKKKEIAKKLEVKKVQKQNAGNPIAGKPKAPYSRPIFVKDIKKFIANQDASFHKNEDSPNNDGSDGRYGKKLEDGNPHIEGEDSTIVIKKDPIIKEVIDLPSYKAEFPGGFNEFLMYLQENLQDEAVEDGINKKITVNFWIEKDGSISNVTTENNDDAAFRAKTKRIIEKSKRWKPEVIKGEFVRVEKNMNITIILPEN